MKMQLKIYHTNNCRIYKRNVVYTKKTYCERFVTDDFLKIM